MSTATLQKESSAKGYIISGTIHIALFLLLFFIVLDRPVSDGGLNGLLIDFGDSETGLGDDNTQLTANNETTPNNYVPPTSAYTPTTTKTTASQTITSDNAEAIAIAKLKKQQELAKQKALEEQKKQAEELAKQKALEEQTKNSVASAFNKNKTSGAGGSGTGEGNNGAGGNQGATWGKQGGDKSGTGTGTGGTGTGSGTSGKNSNYSLQGRTLVANNVPISKESKVGKVVVLIKVDKSGKVIYAKAPYQGSTISDSYYATISEQSAYKFKFSASSDAADEQQGTITFNYGF
ncbi:MAG: hypothetical protein H6553_05070 [Chitinophagales bacterium]|nr:hypothetical protein [Chitinophagales bacterium]